MVSFAARDRRTGYFSARAVVIALGLLALLPGMLYLQVRRHASQQPAEPADVIIVLGSGGNGERPSEVYRARLDHALHLYESQMAPAIIVTERSPGAEAARAYLLDRGVPAEDVLMENRSTTTWENLLFAREVMQQQGWNSAIIASCGFHLYRATAMAQELGMDAQGAAAPASPVEAEPARRERLSMLELRKLLAHAIYEPPPPAVDWWREHGFRW
jgi:uncharacterized SAM-binding protein YcdF (DUF218 family)